ncbi:PREDICTED: uncharacterized protein LOC104822009 isoform X2 [Tarenaya hassleriana]|uniref:uncharacterized protein LOC104822009 isoform X2 n=1 Tax=Tarenaya hassleriana TaxID=28532 RepID=UPI00053C2651|nr:PREDICTED: uncharacterized protein LOC104822009 isoform X2 [Tarenaya hassleriana]
MEPNQTKKKPSHGTSRSKGRRNSNRSNHHPKGNDTADDAESTNREGNGRMVLFQIGSIACYEVYNTEAAAIAGTETSMAEESTTSSTSLSSILSDDMIELRARTEEENQTSYEDNQEKRRNLSNVALHGSPDNNNTPRSRLSGATNGSPLSPTRSPPVQVMEREGYYDPEQRIPSLVFEKIGSLDWSEASNESLFSLSVGGNSLARDFDVSLAKSGELLEYCPSLPIHPEDSEGKTSETEEEQRETDSEEKTSMPILSWRDLSEFDHSDQTLSHSNISDQTLTSLQYFSSPVTKKKNKTRTKRCLSCFSCCRCSKRSCNGCFSCCSCCYSSMELEIIHGEMGTEKNKGTQHKWFCCCTS